MKMRKLADSPTGFAGIRCGLFLLLLGFLALAAAGCDPRDSREAIGGSADWQIHQAGWKEPELIERVQGRIHFHSLAVDFQGRAIALWERDDKFGQDSLWASHYRPNGSWSPPELIELAVGRSSVPALAFDGKGNAVAIWEQNDNHPTGIWSNRYTPENGWGLAVQVEFSQENAYEPKIGFSADGKVLAVWAQRKGRRIGIWANLYTRKAGWSRPSQIDAPPGDSGNVQLASAENGNAVAVWEQNQPGRVKAIFANQFAPGKGWGRARLIGDGREEAIKPRVAQDGEGNAIAVWEQEVHGEESVWANRFTVGEGWERPLIIEQAHHEGYAPEIAIHSSGNAIAVWTREVSGREFVWAALYTVGLGWQPPQRIQTVDAEYAYLPNVAFNRAGDALAAWYQIDAVHNNVWVSRYSRDKGWGKAERIENRTSVVFRPLVTADPTGGFVVFWKMIDGMNPANSIHSLWARRLR